MSRDLDGNHVVIRFPLATAQQASSPSRRDCFPARGRSRLALTLAEREVISRGIVSGHRVLKQKLVKHLRP